MVDEKKPDFDKSGTRLEGGAKIVELPLLAIRNTIVFPVLAFPINVGRERLDAGLRECLEAGKACTGYAINARDVRRERVGSFWSDALAFKRTVEVSGWNFNALVLLVNDRVVYTLYGGQPNLRETEITRRPLGPAQNFGDSMPWGDLVR